MFLALKEIKHAKLRYALIALIMILTAFLVFFISGLAQGLSSADSSALRQVDADYLFLNKEAEGNLTQSELDPATLNTAKAQLGEEQAAPLSIQLGTVTKNDSEKKTYVTFFATDMDSRLAPEVTEGRMISNGTENEIVVNESIQSSGYEIGDTMKESTTGTEFTIVGLIEGQTFSHAPAAYINLKEQKLLRAAYPHQPPLLFNAIAVHGTESDAAEAEKKIDHVEAVTIDEAIKGIPGYSETQGSLTMMTTFLFIISAVILAVFFYVITLQKIGQFGVLKAIGTKTGYLARSIVVQIVLLAVVSLALAILLSFGVARILPETMPFELSGMLIARCSLIFLIVDILGSLISLRRVAKADAIKAIGGVH